LKVVRLEVGTLDVNTYILLSEKLNKAIIIDPGENTKMLLNSISLLDIEYIINTHGHYDHIAGNNEIKSKKGGKLIIHKDDLELLNEPHMNLSTIFSNPTVSVKPDIIIKKEGRLLEMDDIVLDVLFFPGHTKGSMAVYYNTPNQKMLFSGDFIFKNNIGRTDFPGGSNADMKDSIAKVLKLPDEIIVYPGHEEPFELSEFKKIAHYFEEL
jgi:hydroxyacylglutathione hydrolase